MSSYIKFLQEQEKTKTKRRKVIEGMRAKGMTMQLIGKKLGISRQRISEILKK